jgi:hypothetical protein
MYNYVGLEEGGTPRRRVKKTTFFCKEILDEVCKSD